MRELRIKLENFMAYADQEFALDRYSGPVLITGKYVGGDPGESNGAGKSTLIEAVAWSLFGVSRAASDDDLIRLGTDEMKVTNVFEIDGVKYEVVRSRKRGKSQSLLFSDLTNDKKLRGNSVKETQARIVEVLGMDYEVFSNTVYSPQKKLDLFPSQLPSKRKEVLSTILGIDGYADVEERARRLASDHERDAQALGLAIDRIQLEIGQETVGEEALARLEEEVSDLADKSVAANSAVEEAVRAAGEARAKASFHQKLQSDLIQADQSLDRLRSQQEYAERDRAEQLAGVDAECQRMSQMVQREPMVTRAAAEVEAKIKTYEQVEKRLNQLQTEQATLRVQRDGYQRDIEVMDKDLARLRSKLGQVTQIGSRCPTCYSALTEDAQKKIMEDIVAEGTAKRKDYDAKAAQAKSVVERCAQVEAEVRGLANSVAQQGELRRDLDNFKRELSQIEMAKNQVQSAGARRQQVEESFKRRADEIASERTQWGGRKIVAEKSLGSHAYSEAEASQAEARIVAARAQETALANRRAQASQELGVLQARAEVCRSKGKQLEADRVRHKEAVDQQFVYKELTRAFSRNGIPALILDNALGEIQSEVNDVMEKLTGGRIKVEFATQKELKTGKTAETLDIIVSDELGARDFRQYSGGEAARVALAIRMALAKVISRRAGKRVDLVMIDEVSDLDQSGVDAFASTILEIGKDHQVFLVTHLENFGDRIPNKIVIVKDRDGSHVEAEEAIPA